MFQEIKTHEITTDVVIFTIKNNKLQVLLVKRANEPFKGRWAIPGGFIRLSENLDNAALRILKEKTNVDNIYLEQLYTFGDPLRYPSSRVITCAYFALIRSDDIKYISKYSGVIPANSSAGPDTKTAPTKIINNTVKTQDTLFVRGPK